MFEFHINFKKFPKAHQNVDELELEWVEYVDKVFVDNYPQSSAIYNDVRKRVRELAEVYYRHVVKRETPTIFGFSDWLDSKSANFIGDDFVSIQMIFEECDEFTSLTQLDF